MDITQAQTFLAVAAHGSFVEAAARLHVTQSTVSARIRGLEQDLGAALFVRNRSGATLTGAGTRFLPHARNLVLTAAQARHEVGLSEEFRASFRIAGRIALWEEYLPRWTAWMTGRAPDIALQVEIGFEEDMIARLLSGTLDLGVMYTPRHNPGLVIEELFDDTLILVSTRERDDRPADRYVYIDWGPGFYAAQRAGCPDLQNPSRTANIGSPCSCSTNRTAPATCRDGWQNRCCARGDCSRFRGGPHSATRHMPYTLATRCRRPSPMPSKGCACWRLINAERAVAPRF